MGILTIFGKFHSWNREVELDDDSEFGLDVTIVLKDRVRPDHTIPSCTVIRRNCTEFHHLFDKESNAEFIKKHNIQVIKNEQGNSGWESSSAFESDIHGTSGTFRVDDMESIEVVKATELSDCHYESEKNN